MMEKLDRWDHQVLPDLLARRVNVVKLDLRARLGRTDYLV